MMPKVKVKIDSVADRFNALKKAGKDLTKPLNSIGDIMLSSVEENFKQGGRFSTAESWWGGNNRWQDLAESTKAAREKKGKWPGKILDMSQGGLAASISKQIQGNKVAIGSNKEYSGIHQHGGMAGRGRKVKIPARPFLVIQNEDVEEMINILDKHITKK
ncbi:MAG: phage virion morphogenesis protein [Chitinispirillia bacterium]|nr:phage virion morphogenesis protein [Chitinispirillia bacterium]